MNEVVCDYFAMEVQNEYMWRNFYYFLKSWIMHCGISVGAKMDVVFLSVIF